ncbi:heat shock protein 90 [Echinococcus multilocularis]|uniref:Heat shock protein 90 n=1 Tax=Echinococcus multilocularis TaxID=6211 RepID=A0A068YBV0_ECHMU|nr:heat shock protein 90 [Echinococcus multilocularis]
MSDQEATTDNATERKVETFAFQADTRQLLNVLVNALYPTKDVFLRELVSNASDALDKLRYKSLTQPSVLETNAEMCIRIVPNKADATLAIMDTGVGMTKDELVNNLGRIAYSGTRAFMGALKDGAADMVMAGEFGVGFYSAFLVADRVEVVSKSNDDEQYVWEWSGGESFTIRAWNEETLKRGTKVILHMKRQQCVEYLEPHVIEAMVRKYCEFTAYPIKLCCDEEGMRSVMDREEWRRDGEVVDGVVLNRMEPLWMRSAEDISSEEYGKFYKWLSCDSEDHMAVKHFSVEGELSFRALLFVPRRPPAAYFARNGRPHNIRLYVKRVLVTEECESLIPDYLNFLIGVVDSEDLPLNLSRDAIRESSVVRAIGKHLVRKSIELMQEMAEDAQAYSAFYGNFQRSIKLGVYEDRGHRQKLANLLRYYSSKSGDEMIGLREYVCRMKEGQSDIYCMIGESMASVSDSVFMEGLKKRDVEVLLMVDPMDEYVVNAMTEYLGKSLVCVSRLDLQLPEERVEAVVAEAAAAEEERKTTTQGEWMECVVADFEATCGKMKEILGERVESVRVSSRLTTSPCCVVTSTFGWSANMQRIGKAQALRNPHSLRNNSAKKHLEINANDSIIIGLKKMLSTEGMPNKISRDMLEILYNTALLDSGFVLEEPKTHTNTIHALIRMFLEIPECESVKDAEQVTADSDEAALVQAGDDGGAMGEVG